MILWSAARKHVNGKLLHFFESENLLNNWITQSTYPSILLLYSYIWTWLIYIDLIVNSHELMKKFTAST